MATTFPEAASFAGTFVPPPPAFEPKWTADQKADKLREYLNGQFSAINEMQNSIESGWLIDTVRILNLTVDNVFADQILTETLYIGSSQKIQLLGASNTIEIYDEQGTPQLRTRIGDLGTGTSNWGQEWWDSSGTLLMSVGDTVFIQGAVIVDATLTNAKYPTQELTGNRMVNDTLTDTQIGSLSASTINAGVLNVDGSPSAINVTSTGNLNLSGGGDVNLTAQSISDFNYMNFYNYLSSLRATIGLVNSGADLQIDANTGTLDLIGTSGGVVIRASGNTVFVGNDTGDEVHITGDIGANITFDIDSARDIGTTGVRANWIYTDDISSTNGFTTGDINMGNGDGIVITEPNKVWVGGDVTDGIVLMRGIYDWTPFMWIHKDGDIQTKNLPTATIPAYTPEMKKADHAKRLVEINTKKEQRRIDMELMKVQREIDDEPNRLERVRKLAESIAEGKEHQRKKAFNKFKEDISGKNQ